MQSFIRLFLVSYHSYHRQRNKQNLGITKMPQMLAFLTHLTHHNFFTSTLSRNKSTCHILIGILLLDWFWHLFREVSFDPLGLHGSRLWVHTTDTLTLPLPQKWKRCHFATGICTLSKLSLRAISTIYSFVKLRPFPYGIFN